MGNTLSALVPADEGTDLQLARQKSEAVATVEAQVFMAKSYPRNEDVAYQKIMKACERPSFALDATFEFPRGAEKVTGGSIHLAREMKRIWGNTTSGIRLVRDDGETVYGEAFAWDFETNAFTSRQFQVSKYIWKRGRKGEPGRFVLVSPRPRTEDEKDLERDLREKIFNIGGRSERECIFHLIPYDYRADAEAAARETVKSGMSKDPESMRKLVLRGMAKLNIDAEQLEEYLGCKLAKATPKQVDALREIYQKINAGEGTWAELTGQDKPEPPDGKGGGGPIRGSIKMDDFRPSDDPNRGHDNAAPREKPAEEKESSTVEREAAPEALAEKQAELAKLRAGRERVVRIGGLSEPLFELVRGWKRLKDMPTEADVMVAVGAYEGADEDLRADIGMAAERLKLADAGEESQERKDDLFGGGPARRSRK